MNNFNQICEAERGMLLDKNTFTERLNLPISSQGLVCVKNSPIQPSSIIQKSALTLFGVEHLFGLNIKLCIAQEWRAADVSTLLINTLIC